MSAALRPESSPLGREVVAYVVHHTNPKRKRGSFHALKALFGK
jgi:hypothetical protein